MTAKERAAEVHSQYIDYAELRELPGIVEKAIEAAILEERNKWREACGWKGFLCACMGCKHPANCSCACPVCHIERVKSREREACAKIADECVAEDKAELALGNETHAQENLASLETGQYIAAAIRKRSDS